MVKNVKGGSKHKKMARRTVNHSTQSEKVRVSECEDEIYASVSKLYGNGRVSVTCNDNVERNCVIRKKFRGKNKSRGNELRIGTYVLVGRRGFESGKEKEVTDLLYVYSNDQVLKLKKMEEINNKFLSKNETSYGESRDVSGQNENYFDFTDEIKEEDMFPAMSESGTGSEVESDGGVEFVDEPKEEEEEEKIINYTFDGKSFLKVEDEINVDEI
jgi:initiation factor 1A